MPVRLRVLVSRACRASTTTACTTCFNHAPAVPVSAHPRGANPPARTQATLESRLEQTNVICRVRWPVLDTSEFQEAPRPTLERSSSRGALRGGFNNKSGCPVVQQAVLWQTFAAPQIYWSTPHPCIQGCVGQRDTGALGTLRRARPSCGATACCLSTYTTPDPSPTQDSLRPNTGLTATKQDSIPTTRAHAETWNRRCNNTSFGLCWECVMGAGRVYDTRTQNHREHRVFRSGPSTPGATWRHVVYTVILTF